MSEKFLSIITINYNNKDGLKRTLDSVFCQSSDDFEYIIVDGESTDGGAELIAEYLAVEENKCHVSFWCSEKDGGIWDAMNKGVSHANGKYVLMLNSGDVLRHKDIISDLVKLKFTEDIIYTDASFVTSKGSNIIKYPDCITDVFFIEGSTLGHQNSLISTELSKRIPYHLDYKYAGDIVFFVESIICNKCSTRHLKYPVVDFDAETGISSIKSTEQERFDEWIRIWQTYFPGELRKKWLLLNEYRYGYKGILRRLKKIFDWIKK